MEIENKIQFLDGAMGTQLQDKGSACRSFSGAVHDGAWGNH
ncbi:MAG: hypothetical protein ACLRY6_09875 [[Clostridium] innocuum]